MSADGSRHALFASDMRALHDELNVRKEFTSQASKWAHTASNRAEVALHEHQCGNAESSSIAFQDAVQAYEFARAEALKVFGAEEGCTPLEQATSSIVAFEAFNSFLTTGGLGNRSSKAYTNESWLCGLISASHEIVRCFSALFFQAPRRSRRA